MALKEHYLEIGYHQFKQLLIEFKLSEAQVNALADMVPDADWLDTAAQFWFGTDTKQAFKDTLNGIKIECDNMFHVRGDCENFDAVNIVWVYHHLTGPMKVFSIKITPDFRALPEDSSETLKCECKDKSLGRAKVRYFFINWQVDIEIGSFQYTLQAQTDKINTVTPCCCDEKEQDDKTPKGGKDKPKEEEGEKPKGGEEEQEGEIF